MSTRSATEAHPLLVTLRPVVSIVERNIVKHKAKSHFPCTGVLFSIVPIPIFPASDAQNKLTCVVVNIIRPGREKKKAWVSIIKYFPQVFTLSGYETPILV
jgi:hypothetical protein